MTRTDIAGLLGALLLHGFVLFGISPGTPARPETVADESVELSLVAAAPEAAPDFRARAGVSSTPEPAPTPAPEPEPTPVPIVPDPTPKPKPANSSATSRPTPEVRRKVASKEAHPKSEGPASMNPNSNSNGSATTGAPARGPTTTARLRSNPRPKYPEEARRQRQQGVVMIRVTVDSSGRPERVDLAKSSGIRSLDAAALEAVGGWRFAPARTGGIPMTSEVVIPVRFDLSR